MAASAAASSVAVHTRATPAASRAFAPARPPAVVATAATATDLAVPTTVRRAFVIATGPPVAGAAKHRAAVPPAEPRRP